MRVRTAKPENMHYFALYKEKNIFLSLARQFGDNFLTASSKSDAEHLLNELVLSAASYEDSIYQLNKVMSKDGLVKYRTQFRQFKARTKDGTKHLAIRKETYNKIVFMASRFDSLDQFFENLLAPDVAVEMYEDMKKLEKEDLPTALSADEKVALIMREKNKRQRADLLKSIEAIFSLGFDEGAKAQLGDKRRIKTLKKSLFLSLKELVNMKKYLG